MRGTEQQSVYVRWDTSAAGASATARGAGPASAAWRAASECALALWACCLHWQRHQAAAECDQDAHQAHARREACELADSLVVRAVAGALAHIQHWLPDLPRICPRISDDPARHAEWCAPVCRVSAYVHYSVQQSDSHLAHRVDGCCEAAAGESDQLGPGPVL